MFSEPYFSSARASVRPIVPMGGCLIITINGNRNGNGSQEGAIMCGDVTIFIIQHKSQVRNQSLLPHTRELIQCVLMQCMSDAKNSTYENTTVGTFS